MVPRVIANKEYLTTVFYCLLVIFPRIIANKEYLTTVFYCLLVILLLPFIRYALHRTPASIALWWRWEMGIALVMQDGCLRWKMGVALVMQDGCLGDARWLPWWWRCELPWWLQDWELSSWWRRGVVLWCKTLLCHGTHFAKPKIQELQANRDVLLVDFWAQSHAKIDCKITWFRPFMIKCTCDLYIRDMPNTPVIACPVRFSWLRLFLNNAQKSVLRLSAIEVNACLVALEALIKRLSCES